jgi:hypothetical protein
MRFYSIVWASRMSPSTELAPINLLGHQRRTAGHVQRYATLRLRDFEPGFQHIRLKGYGGYPYEHESPVPEICGRLSDGRRQMACFL